MTLTVTPSQDDVYQAMEAFLAGILPAGVPVIRGLPNLAAMPPSPPGFVSMQALFEGRLRMPITTYATESLAVLDSNGHQVLDSNGNPVENPPFEFSIEQGLELPMQIDCYGKHSGTWASLISTAFQSPYGCAALAPNCQPLYCNEARMIPLVNEELNYEERWSLDCHLQYDPVVTAPQQYTNELELALKNVTVEYPA